MQIAFFGAYKSFDYHQIGGMDSLARRLGIELIQRSDEVSFVHFNCPEERSGKTAEGISISYFVRFDDALRFMARRFDHVLTIYVPPKQRLIWMRFRNKESHRTYFHKLYSGWSEYWLKRTMGFAEAMIMPYNGTLFCVSPRLKQQVSKWSKRAALLLPPVPESYFLKPEDKPKNKRLRITYMGRVDPGKGVSVAIGLFRYLAKKAPEIQTRICGYPWKHKPETMKFHEELLTQDEIIYEPTVFEGYSQAVDKNVRRVLRETDILFLPYDKLSSTIDTPLLLLEGMAHLCVVITRPLGGLPEVYGSGEFMLPNISDKERCLELLRQLSGRLNEERIRLAIQNKKLKFQACEVARQFSSLLGGH
jgi:glycosyltransferase involved in cell wall biosynthesis